VPVYEKDAMEQGSDQSRQNFNLFSTFTLNDMWKEISAARITYE
jgi:hypothetical protein